ncbi:hypothetical protein ACTWJ8_39855 (plasmid) [Streptomyces sp. SDT5-1]|uniref:hypothetical protein n=1 Tax=Streptomyces sp. SDT5-1 TaxID=3406418 RepID=UPI003FD1CE1C
MPLDMTGVHQHAPGVHYRRYLSQRDHRIIVICVQNFDYHHYEASRFVDLQSFTSEERARLTPLSTADVLHQMERLEGDDTVGALQGQRILRELNRTSYPDP